MYLGVQYKNMEIKWISLIIFVIVFPNFKFFFHRIESVRVIICYFNEYYKLISVNGCEFIISFLHNNYAFHTNSMIIYIQSKFQ